MNGVVGLFIEFAVANCGCGGPVCVGGGGAGTRTACNPPRETQPTTHNVQSALVIHGIELCFGKAVHFDLATTSKTLRCRGCLHCVRERSDEYPCERVRTHQGWYNGSSICPDLDQPFFDVRVEDKQLKQELSEIAKADFIAFDERFFDLIGPRPKLESMFNLSRDESLKEAPVYIPSSNSLFISDIGARKQMRIDLTEKEPTFEYIELKPPLATINGAAYSEKDGLIYVTVHTSDGVDGGIYSIDPDTLERKVVLNNFLGHRFNSPNDLVIAENGLFFTDPPYAQIMGNGSAAQLRPNVYFFDPSSHVLRPVEEDLQLPNGIALSPDGKTLYIADSGALCQPIGKPTVSSKHRSIYAYDLVNGLATNRRLVYIADFWVPDGIKVSESGNLYAAAGIFVDIISPDGVLLGKIQTAGLMQNLIFAGPELNELWLVGIGGVYRTRISDQGIPFSKKTQFFIQ